MLAIKWITILARNNLYVSHFSFFSYFYNLIRKVHVDAVADGSVTTVQFCNETLNDEDFQIAATENQEINVNEVEQDLRKF